MKRTISLIMLVAGMICQLSAHALWIETPSKGVKNQQQTVKIYYGEYAQKELENVGDWYSDVSQFTLWLIAPDGSRTQLETHPEANCFVASFTPEKEGIYTLVVAHDAKFEGATKYQFNAAASVAVGQSLEGKENQTGQDISTTLNSATAVYKVNKPVDLTALLQGQPAEDISVEVFSPAGWNMSLTSDKEGKVSFTPVWKGVYMIEASKFRPEQGELNGVKFEKVWRCATYLIEVR